MRQKKPSDVLGAKMMCTSFQQCPLCYGCRSYRTDIPECQKCAVNRKKNICDTNKHKADLISKMVLRPSMKIDNVKFKSYKGGSNNGNTSN